MFCLRSVCGKNMSSDFSKVRGTIKLKSTLNCYYFLNLFYQNFRLFKNGQNLCIRLLLIFPKPMSLIKYGKNKMRNRIKYFIIDKDGMRGKCFFSKV